MKIILGLMAVILALIGVAAFVLHMLTRKIDTPGANFNNLYDATML